MKQINSQPLGDIKNTTNIELTNPLNSDLRYIIFTELYGNLDIEMGVLTSIVIIKSVL